MLCHPGYFLHCFTAGKENLRVIRIAGYRRRERHTCRQHGINYCTFLHGKAEKSIQIDRCAVQRVTFCQTVAQVCQTVSRVGQGLLAQALICR